MLGYLAYKEVVFTVLMKNMSHAISVLNSRYFNCFNSHTVNSVLIRAALKKRILILKWKVDWGGGGGFEGGRGGDGGVVCKMVHFNKFF